MEIKYLKLRAKPNWVLILLKKKYGTNGFWPINSVCNSIKQIIFLILKSSGVCPLKRQPLTPAHSTVYQLMAKRSIKMYLLSSQLLYIHTLISKGDYLRILIFKFLELSISSSKELQESFETQKPDLKYNLLCHLISPPISSLLIRI